VNAATVNSPGTNTAMQAQIDLVRGLPGALVNSYLYSIYGDVIAATDPTMLTSKYDYDNIGRLEHIRDKDNNILKKYAYAYQAQPYNQDVFYSDYIIANIARTDCASPCFTPTAVQYIQPGGKFTSLSSQSAAQTAAQNDITTNNNAYAIANGSVCVPIAYSQLNNATNWIIPYSDFYPQAGVVTASMVIIPQVNSYGTWSTYILIGTLNCAAGKPSVVRTVTATESGRTWQVEINTSGQVRIRLTGGTPPSGTPSMQLNFTYNL
jgi:YD repeat-containing protein